VSDDGRAECANLDDCHPDAFCFITYLVHLNAFALLVIKGMEKTIDIDECKEGSDNCANCTNTKGSFECSCLSGF
jgi:hypothetical protein